MNSRESIFRRNVANTLYRALFLLAVALPVALQAQTAGEGTITGTVTSVVPLLTLTVHAEAAGPVERFTAGARP